MMILDFLKKLFVKKQTNTDQIKFENDLKKWKDVKDISPTFIYMLIDDNTESLIDIASALVHTDDITLNHILNCADELGKKHILVSLIKKQSKITKKQSDKMKVHVMNNLIDKRYKKFMRGAKGIGGVTGIGGAYFGLVLLKFFAIIPSRISGAPL